MKVPCCFVKDIKALKHHPHQIISHYPIKVVADFHFRQAFTEAIGIVHHPLQGIFHLRSRQVS